TWVCSELLLKQRNLAAQLSDPCADPNLSVVCLRLLHQGGEQLANGIVSTKASGGKWGMAFAQCEHVCAPFNQERDHFGAPLHARNMQGGVTEIASLVDVDASVNESLGGRKIAPSHNEMECIVAIAASCIHIRKVGLGKVRRFA